MRKRIAFALVAIALIGFVVTLRRQSPPTPHPSPRTNSSDNHAERTGAQNEDATLPATSTSDRDNPYLKKVDEELDDLDVRKAIRRVQPACVRIGDASGVNLAPQGLVLTAAHVARPSHPIFEVTFPDGRSFTGEWRAIDSRHDLALYRLDDGQDLPFATLADAPPEVGSAVICIGQPGSTTPQGEPTDYEPFDVSKGEIRGFLGDPSGHQQPLGRTMHDAWTYWGHSGAPLFSEHGHIVAMHNSWDPRNAMRHAVNYEAIQNFLQGQGIVEALPKKQ